MNIDISIDLPKDTLIGEVSIKPSICIKTKRQLEIVMRSLGNNGLSSKEIDEIIETISKKYDIKE